MATELVRRLSKWAHVDRDAATRLDLALAAAVLLLLALLMVGVGMVPSETRPNAGALHAESQAGARAAGATPAAARTTGME